MNWSQIVISSQDVEVHLILCMPLSGAGLDGVAPTACQFDDVPTADAFYRNKNKGLTFQDVFVEPLMPTKKRLSA